MENGTVSVRHRTGGEGLEPLGLGQTDGLGDGLPLGLGGVQVVLVVLTIGVHRDMENGTVSVRHRTGEDLGAMSLDAFAALLQSEVDSREIK